MATTEQVEHDGLVLDVRVDGPADGTPVLLLHGFPQSSACWDAVAPGLHALGLRTLAPDQRGYAAGAVPARTQAYRLDALVGDALAVLDALAPARSRARPLVVGHDWGAVVAWALAADHPDRLAGLVAISVPHPRAYAAAVASDADQRARSAYQLLFRREGEAERVLLADGARRLRSLFAGSGLDDAGVDRYVAPLAAEGGRRLTGALSWYRAAGPGQMLAVGTVTVPTTFVWSDEDVAVGRAAADRCGDHVSGPYTRTDLAGVSHWVPEAAPEAVVDAVAGLRSHRP